MKDVAKYTFVWILCLAIALWVAVTLLFYLRRWTIEWVHPDPWKLKAHWWRFAIPFIIAIVFASFSMDVSMPMSRHFLWISFAGIFLPFWLVWASLREVLARKFERVFGIIALLLVLNTSLLTAGWAFARRAQSMNYQGPANIVDWNKGGTFEHSVLKFQLGWTCYYEERRGNFECRDDRIYDCDEITRRERLNDRDYDMTLYNDGTFIDCYNGFDRDAWKNYGWFDEKWAFDDDNVDDEDDDNANDRDRKLENDVRPYMNIIGDCSTCELDEHSGGNLYRAKRNLMIIPLWLISLLVAFATPFFHDKRRSKNSEQLLEEKEIVGA